MIEVRGLSKSFGSVVAVRDLSFRIKERTITGLLGPNGAGKTTTLRMLAGVLGPSAGTIAIAGHDIVESPIEARASLGYLAETSPLYTEMRVADYLHYRAALKGVARKQCRRAVDEATADARCTEVRDAPISHLSRGYRQRVGLADALLARPQVLLLDEPTAGLDPNQIRDVRTLVTQLAQKHTILLSTHVLAEVESSCTEAVVIHRGELVAHDTIERLRERRHGTNVILKARDPNHQVAEICRPLGWQVHSETVLSLGDDPRSEGAILQYELCSESRDGSSGMHIESLVARLVKGEIGLREVYPSQASLEAVFSELTKPSEARPA